jgi:2-dehydro-3-deoxygluconokinase
MSPIAVRSSEGTRWDCVALGEVMLRLDPGEERIARARSFRAWEGGGEYNVARGLARVFGLRATVVTALADNPVGHLVEDLMLAGAIDLSNVVWRHDDGVGRTVRNGLNFTERGFGVRGALGCSDRGHTAASQLKRGDVDWQRILASQGARWFHTGGIFAALSDTTPQVAAEAMAVARANGTVISYDLNYRPSLWASFGGQQEARRVNRELVRQVDVLFGNEEDFTAALAFDGHGADPALSSLDPAGYAQMAERVTSEFPNLKAVATTLRVASTASHNDWGAVLWMDGAVHYARARADLEILDRVGGGDSFASGLIYALLSGKGPAEAVEWGATHGALAMTTPGDVSMATLGEVEKLAQGGSARAQR